MKKALFLSIALIFNVTIAFGANISWDKEPKEFRGVPFGTSEKELNDKIPNLKCIDSKVRGRACYDSDFKIGEIQIKNQSFILIKDRVSQIYMNFDSNNYKFIRDVFIEKYGQPTSADISKIKTRAGVEYENEQLLWLGDKILIRMSRYGGSITDSAVLFMEKSIMPDIVKDSEEKKKKAASDF